MFASDIENRIIDTIRKNPLGLTSSEIARYLGINRITLTKYLAVIKEKTLIDFKQLGMAKLWYIPIKLNKETFLSGIISNLALNIPKTDLKNLFEKAGMDLAEEINLMYKDFYNVKKLNLDQLLEVFVNIGKKVGGNLKVKSVGEDKVTIEIVENPFKNENTDVLNNALTGLFGKIASLNFSYSKTLIEKVKEGNEEKELLYVYLKKSEEKKQ